MEISTLNSHVTEELISVEEHSVGNTFPDNNKGY